MAESVAAEEGGIGMKVWFAVIAFLLGTTMGVAGGFALADPEDPEALDPQAAAPVPPPCLEAISAARDRLLLNPDVSETLRDYRKLGQRIGDEVSNLRVPNLRETLGELNDLNERSGDLIDRSVNTRFSGAANECERIASEREGLGTPAD